MAPLFTGLKLGGFGKNPDVAGGGGPFSATGGTKTTIGSYTYHDFTTSGPNPFVVTGGPYPANILLVGGGGSGSTGNPGEGGQSGGGAGGVIIAPLTLDSGPYTVVIGSGGPSAPPYGNGNPGFDSTFGPNWVAQGGGGGAYYTPSPFVTQGGSPGGQYGNAISPLNQTNNPALPADSRTFGFGNQGGPGGSAGCYGGGGGGGAGGAGSAGDSIGTGTGGSAKPTAPVPWLTGTPFFSPTSQLFAGGGGGASRCSSAPGGSGGAGGGNHGGAGGNATGNTGSGGGGGVSVSGTGGSGRVIIAYLTA